MLLLLRNFTSIIIIPSYLLCHMSLIFKKVRIELKWEYFYRYPYYDDKQSSKYLPRYRQRLFCLVDEHDTLTRIKSVKRCPPYRKWNVDPNCNIQVIWVFGSDTTKPSDYILPVFALTHRTRLSRLLVISLCISLYVQH